MASTLVAMASKTSEIPFHLLRFLLLLSKKPLAQLFAALPALFGAENEAKTKKASNTFSRRRSEEKKGRVFNSTSSFLLLVRCLATSSYLLLVEMPGATSSFFSFFFFLFLSFPFHSIFFLCFLLIATGSNLIVFFQGHSHSQA